MRRGSKVAIVVGIIVAVGIFAYVEYVSATHLNISILHSKVVHKTNTTTLYNMTIQFRNPSLLPLTIGKTDFIISINGENLGTGTFEPFAIPPIGRTVSQSPFLAENTILDKYNKTDNIPNVKLTGTSKYDILIVSVNVPFTYYPTQDEAREFIHPT
jgi:LEA14-like dessication related protein